MLSDSQDEEKYGNFLVLLYLDIEYLDNKGKERNVPRTATERKEIYLTRMVPR